MRQGRPSPAKGHTTARNGGTIARQPGNRGRRKRVGAKQPRAVTSPKSSSTRKIAQAQLPACRRHIQKNERRKVSFRSPRLKILSIVKTRSVQRRQSVFVHLVEALIPSQQQRTRIGGDLSASFLVSTDRPQS